MRRRSSWPVAGWRFEERRPRRGRGRSAAAVSGTKCGLGRKRTSKTRSAPSGSPCLKPKLSKVSTSGRGASRSRDSAEEDLPQLVHGEVGGVDDLVGHGADAGHLPPLEGDGVADRLLGRQRMRPPGLAEAAVQHRVAGLEEDERRRHVGGGAQPGEGRRERREEPPLADVDHDRDPGQGLLFAVQRVQVRQQRQRQVVDAVVAQVLDGVDGLRLPRARQPGDDQEVGPRRAGAEPRPAALHAAPSAVEVVAVVGVFEAGADALEPLVERVDEVAGGVDAAGPQQLVARRHLDQDRDAAARRHRHRHLGNLQAEQVVVGVVEAEPVVVAGRVPALQLDDELDPLGAAGRGDAEQIADVDQARGRGSP